jgi:RNA polymerase sigma factor (sigma-70 family)
MKAAKHPPRGRRKREPADMCGKPQDLFDLVYPLAKRSAEVRSSSIPRYANFDRGDLEQEALIGVWRAIERFDQSRASLRTFVERIVSNRIASNLRRARAGKRTKPPDYGPLVESPPMFVTVELRLDIDCALATLGRRERKVARLLEGYRPAEIARVLGISRAAVYRIIDTIRETFIEAGLP